MAALKAWDPRKPWSFSQLLNVPAVYGLCEGKGHGTRVVYVGATKTLKRRLVQHLINRDTSVITGKSAARLDPEHVTEVRWWEHDLFKEQDALEGAELVAFGVLDPVLKSQGNPSGPAKRRSKDEDFRQEMRSLFSGESSGRFIVPTPGNLLDRIEKRIEKLERRFDSVEKRLPKANR